ncbi:hypothetical protein GCM10007939_19890 [Amylibacter marinus]|uniref:YHYH domain-containing protein n=1 Tax=Amylibacter marinus TaxID=1475483 RepID=A0ABQ5VWU9_9RHOB|nr:YHYH protein [Amylibacter marinus]GLQ35706.1 hypothetical protein GCM10007939_19890 [Amylibacter marinus]
MQKFIVTALAIGLGASALAADNQVTIVTKGTTTCIQSNGIPDHDMGAFPRRGNPNSFRAQNQKYCFSANPKKRKIKSTKAQIVGVTLTGIPIRPGTADWYDASSPRGHSRDSSSGWNLDGMGPDNALGLDHNNAHVDHRGLYHYHGMPAALIDLNNDTLMGYAADGHEIHYVGAKAQASWVLKSGVRPSGPGGRYDGTYNQDFEYKAGSGNLDECNGAMVNGQYVYFATDSYPYFQRCHFGAVSDDFVVKRAPRDRQRPRKVRRG